MVHRNAQMLHGRIGGLWPGCLAYALTVWAGSGCSRRLQLHPGPSRLRIVAAPAPHTPGARIRLWELLWSMPGCAHDDASVLWWIPPSPGFHVHVTADGRILINGKPDVPEAIGEHMKSGWKRVDSVPISVLLTADDPDKTAYLCRAVAKKLYVPRVMLFLPTKGG